jgi:uncharacterized membrane protein
VNAFCGEGAPINDGGRDSTSEGFKPEGLLDRSFEIGIILKGLDGILEVVGGLLLLVVTPATINHVVTSLTQHELSRDPHDFIASHLLHASQGLTGSGALFAAIYLLSHGAVKIVLVAALLRNKLWAYPWTIAFLVVFIGYQTYRMTFKPTLGLAALTIFDIVVVWLTVREYRKQRRRVRPNA